MSSGLGKFIEDIPVCPSGGKYTFVRVYPKIRELAYKCSLAKEKKEHVPLIHHDW